MLRDRDPVNWDLVVAEIFEVWVRSGKLTCFGGGLSSVRVNFAQDLLQSFQ